MRKGVKRCESVAVNRSSISGYGCGREAYIARRSSKTNEDSDNQRIVITSMDDSGYGTEASSASPETILGGRRRSRKTRRRKTRCRK